MKSRIVWIVVLLALGLNTRLDACTSVIVTGKMTPDGRPLMWKHRDTDASWNHMAFFNDARYRFVGLMNSNDDAGGVWTGMNEAGFAIMNTASYNLKDDDVKEMDQEGQLMRKALGICKTVKDFENFLDTLSRPMRVEANFGVIDAYGGAAYYETNNSKYYKMDANDPELAPNGYLVYTNFSFHGRKDKGLGYIRYETARKLFSEFKKDDFTPRNILGTCSRSFYNSLLGYDLKDEKFSPNQAKGWFVEQDFIPRKESTSALVIQGVKPGMSPELATMWTVIGYPPVSVAMPVWVKMENELPSLLAASEKSGKAPMCEKAMALRGRVYPIHRGNGQKYLNWNLLYNDGQTGIMQQLQPVEDEVFAMFGKKQPEWEKNGLNKEEVRQLYKQASDLIEKTYREKFGL